MLGGKSCLYGHPNHVRGAYRKAIRLVEVVLNDFCILLIFVQVVEYEKRLWEHLKAPCDLKIVSLYSASSFQLLPSNVDSRHSSLEILRNGEEVNILVGRTPNGGIYCHFEL